tara:strand:+ start:68891 stop:69943 length:1053 start_codon:yes stop_codon:yes gene_type:complete
MIKKSHKAGLPPGSLIHIGDKKTDQTEVTEVFFSRDKYSEQSYKDLKKIKGPIETDQMRWINVNGLHDTDLISKMGEIFNLHPLLLEDVLDTSIRPKVEEYENYLFMSLKILKVEQDENLHSVDQVSLILGRNWLITIQEKPCKIFDDLIERTRLGKGKIPDNGVDYLMFRILDTIIDNYLFIVERINDQVLSIEEEVIDNSYEDSRERILTLRKQLINFKKLVFPLRDRLGYFGKESNEFITQYCIRYFADVHENVRQILDAIESQGEMLKNVMELYQSGVANKTNQVMQLLTIVSTVFIPLTFIAGIYGMNFEHMPELAWGYGYFFTLGFMATITAGMLWYFKRKGWF